MASFTATVGAATEIVLNGSASSDPEGDPLTYIWKDNGTEVGRGIVLTSTRARGQGPPSRASGEVQDPSGLSTATPRPDTHGETL